MSAETHKCLVCGFGGLYDPPLFGGAGSYEICPCCGFQFGYDDEDQGWTFEAWRDRWVAGGMTWRSQSRSAPEGWDPNDQLQRLHEGS